VELSLLIVYAAMLTFILGYSFVQLSLVLKYRRAQKNLRVEPPAPDNWPSVTIQLPVYNEQYVIERLIDATAAIDYPAERLEIQVIDDGNDASVELAVQRIAFWSAKGVNIKHVRRSDRKGYKAGALAYALDLAQGEFTAIFDADFVPTRDFLKRTIPHFIDQKVGMVQTRWKHLNQDYSLLTRLQAFGLDAHFTVEQVGRNEGNHFMNFNGTGGVWRKSCIRDAGGWQHDTITEDLDLSYRAQLRGWQFIYLEGVGSPAELPAEMNALKNQQFRWTKGAAECAVKNLPAVLRNKELSGATRLHAMFHLLNSSVFLSILGAAVLSIPVLLIKEHGSQHPLLFNLAAVFLLGLLILTFFYWTSNQRTGRSLKQFLFEFPLFLAVSLGLSLHNSIAVVEGLLGRKTPFVRTPKFAISTQQGTWKDKVYRARKAHPLTLVEAALGLYFLAGLVYGIVVEEYGLVPFHVMLSFGFLYVAGQSYLHSRSA
jgi:cellulose synthase/poly-beta-1,6-N-acetylglucosamine synthase-like glycosyltransferase